MKSLSCARFSNMFSVIKCSSSVDYPVRHVTETVIHMQHPIWFTQAILMWFIILLESSAIKTQFRDKLPDNAVYSKCYSIQFTKDSSGGGIPTEYFAPVMVHITSVDYAVDFPKVLCSCGSFFPLFIVWNVQNVSCSLKNIWKICNNTNNSISTIAVFGYIRCNVQCVHLHHITHTSLFCNATVTTFYSLMVICDLTFTIPLMQTCITDPRCSDSDGTLSWPVQTPGWCTLGWIREQ